MQSLISFIVLLYADFYNILLIECGDIAIPHVVYKYENEIIVADRKTIAKVNEKCKKCEKIITFSQDASDKEIIDIEVREGRINVLMTDGQIYSVDNDGSTKLINNNVIGELFFKCIKTDSFICFTISNKLFKYEKGNWNKLGEINSFGKIKNLRMVKIDDEVFIYGSKEENNSEVSVLIIYRKDKFIDKSTDYKNYSSILSVKKCGDISAIIARKNVDNRLDPYELFLILIDKNNKRIEEKIPSYIIPYDIGCYKGNIILFNTDFGDNKTILIFDRSIKKSKMIRIGGDIDFIKGYEIDNELLFYYKRGKIGLFYWEDEQRE